MGAVWRSSKKTQKRWKIVTNKSRKLAFGKDLASNKEKYKVSTKYMIQQKVKNNFILTQENSYYQNLPF